MMWPDNITELAREYDFIVETHRAESVVALRLRMETNPATRKPTTVTRHTLSPLPGGDACTLVGTTRIGFEVKDAKDLVASWSGPKLKCKRDCPLCKGKGCQRLDNQMARMLAHHDLPVVLYHGWFGATPNDYLIANGRFTARQWDGMWNAVLKWEERGVRFQPAVDRRHVARRMMSVADYVRRRGLASLRELPADPTERQETEVKSGRTTKRR